jgi:hypothetical protein
MKIKNYLVILVLETVFAMSVNFVSADSDFILELQNVNKEPIVSKLEINGENFLQICPINNCKIEFTNSSFNPPKPDNMIINHTIDFNLKYNSTDANVVPMKKEHTEKFSESMNSCIIYEIIEDKRREIYFCENGTNSVSRNSDSKSWYYDSIGIYDAIKNTYTVKGDLIDNSTY